MYGVCVAGVGACLSTTKADLEAGMFYGGGQETKINPTNKPLTSDFVSLHLKGRTDGFALKGGDATQGTLQTMYDGVRCANRRSLPPTTIPHSQPHSLPGFLNGTQGAALLWEFNGGGGGGGGGVNEWMRWRAGQTIAPLRTTATGTESTAATSQCASRA
jgi:hypothetical protein